MEMVLPTLILTFTAYQLSDSKTLQLLRYIQFRRILQPPQNRHQCFIIHIHLTRGYCRIPGTNTWPATIYEYSEHLNKSTVIYMDTNHP